MATQFHPPRTHRHTRLPSISVAYSSSQMTPPVGFLLQLPREFYTSAATLAGDGSTADLDEAVNDAEVLDDMEEDIKYKVTA